MRVMLRALMDTAAANEAAANGTLQQVISRLMDKVNPEAAYFGLSEGVRTCWFVFDLQDSWQLPAINQELFLQLGAEIEVHPVMNREDLGKGLGALQSA